MNSIVHFEIPAKDKERSKKFYETVFGWKFEDVPQMDYTMVHTVELDDKYMPVRPGAINGGMMTEEANGGMNPVLVIDTPSVDEYLQKVVDAGGVKLSDKAAVGDMGFYARAKDTEGMVIGIWETAKK
jgi:predicted enzyme related to lactoylglutathione lyase